MGFARNLIRRALLGVLALLILGLAAATLLLSSAPIPERAARPIDLERVRALAKSTSALPASVELIESCHTAFPKVAVVGGDYLGGMQPMAMVAYRLVYPDGSYGLIDSGMPESVCRGLPGGRPNVAGQRTIDAALPGAKFVVLTHEHMDHAGGVAHFPGRVPGARITAEQLHSSHGVEAGFTKARARDFKPLAYDELEVIAPGVVLIKAPGHTPGSQMILVERDAGKPLLFVGDIAWVEENLTRGLARPRLISLVGSEDNAAIRDQLRAIVDAAAAGGVIAVVGHDGAQFERLIADGTLRRAVL